MRASLWPLRLYARIAPTERGGYRLVRAARRLVPRRSWRGGFTIPGGVTLNLDLATYPDCCMAVGLYELDTYRTLRRLLPLGTALLDVGANLGYFSLLAARWVGPGGRVDSIEPDPLNRQRLQENLAANGLQDRVHVHAIAASDHAGELRLWHPEGEDANHGMASTVIVPEGPAREFMVRAERLADVVADCPDVVKMDVEGAELSALRGMEPWLSGKQPPKLVIEHNHVGAAAAGYRCGDLLRYLRTLRPDYRAWWIGWRKQELVGPEQIDGIARQGNIIYAVGPWQQ